MPEAGFYSLFFLKDRSVKHFPPQLTFSLPFNDNELNLGQGGKIMKYSPKYYADFEEKFPEIARDFSKLAQAAHQAGPLDVKCRRLVKLGIAIGIGSEGDVQSHVSQAIDEGLTAEEIRHAILQTITTAGFPKMIETMVWAEEILAKKC